MRIPNVRMSWSGAKASPGGFLLVPGLFLVLLGVVALIAPRFILALVAGFCLFVGALLCLVAFKIAQLQKRFARMAREFEGRIVVHGVDVVRPGDVVQDINVEPISKKIIYH